LISWFEGDSLRPTNVRIEGLEGERVCILLSGGVDSCVLATELVREAREVYPVYIRSGLIWEDVELYWVRLFLSAFPSLSLGRLKEIQLPLGDVYNAHWSTTGHSIPDHRSADHEVYLPGRNLILLAKTALHCARSGIAVIALGVLKGNPFPDSTAEFFSRFRAAASQALNSELQIIAPFSDLSKVEVIQLGRSLPLELTFSCINPIGKVHCGACNKCAERRRSFILAGVADKTRYHSHPAL
jgi:7-cyano-7-deazaguanine synthase